ncbi:hypothetical protein CCUS01_13695 [Colletotrichum cuscutae]|uniref:Uncharacterized protein n=1 Tax=Colletotrichum cuscutae TaxID=1209917 RepID=A0AAJ0DN71_9PEZI|nr:hypothetical protein CCUS01_13695 [Colletotrichum cuscutae]
MAGLQGLDELLRESWISRRILRKRGNWNELTPSTSVEAGDLNVWPCKLRWAGEVINQTRTIKDYVILLDPWRAGFRATSQKDGLRFRAAVAGWCRFLIVHIPNRLTHNTQILNIVLEAFGGEHYLPNLWPVASTVFHHPILRSWQMGVSKFAFWFIKIEIGRLSRSAHELPLRWIVTEPSMDGGKGKRKEKIPIIETKVTSENEEIWTNLTNRPNISASSARVSDGACNIVETIVFQASSQTSQASGGLPPSQNPLGPSIDTEAHLYPWWTLNLGAWPWKEGRRLYTESGSEAKCQDVRQGLPAELSWNPGGHGYAVTSRNLYAAGRELRGPKARLKKIRWWFEGDENVGWFTQSVRRSVTDGVHCEYTLLCILAFLLGCCSGAMRRPGCPMPETPRAAARTTDWMVLVLQVATSRGDEIGIPLMSVHGNLRSESAERDGIALCLRHSLSNEWMFVITRASVAVSSRIPKGRKMVGS